jgi:uncharacterized membrane protein SpoIIM required for sporulation
MVIESLFDPCTIRRHPSVSIIEAVIATSVAIAICIILRQNGLFLTFLITLALLPSVVSLLKEEEERGQNEAFWTYCYKGGFLNRHGSLIKDYFYIILGVALTISIAYLALPHETTSTIFHDQRHIISDITGNVTEPDIFSKILLNNLGVMTICFVFSLFYSTGAIFLIAWNASVLGVVVGQGAQSLLGYHSIPAVLMLYIPHGSFEFLGYILAGIAGGILSISLSRHKESPNHFRFIMKDSLLLLVLAAIMLWIGAWIEVLAIS